MNLSNIVYTVPERQLSEVEIKQHNQLVEETRLREKNSRKKTKGSFKFYNLFSKSGS